jgi:hypothetical protein
MSDRVEKKEPRNLVLCFDGTGDWIGSDRTNVAQIYQALDKQSQLCFYDGGVGTLSDPKALTWYGRTFLRLLDLATATSLRDKVLRGYAFVVDNYREGDRVMMFGFSRGAFTARLLASMMHNFGVLPKESGHLAPYLWQALSNVRDIWAFKDQADRIRGDFCCREVDIDFMGLFDTVSSVGIIARFNVYPNTDRFETKRGKGRAPERNTVLRVCHAVSIDERRNAFPESLINPAQKGLTEVWFPGVHRDSGGGLESAKSRIADEALQWMEYEAANCGVRLTALHTPDPKKGPIPNYPSYDPYIFLGLYPMKMFTKSVLAFRFLWPNFQHLRRIPEFSLVHEIAFQLKESDSAYRPANWPDMAVPFKTGSTLQGPKRYILKPTRMNAADLVGTTFGAALLMILWDRDLNGAKNAWPKVEPYGSAAVWLAVMVVLFLASLFIGPALADRKVRVFRLRPDNILPAAGAVFGLLFTLMYGVYGSRLYSASLEKPWTLLRLYDQWPLLWQSLGVGLLWWVLSQAPPLPVLRSDRSLPYFLGVIIASIGISRFQRLTLQLMHLPVSPGFRHGYALTVLISVFTLGALYVLRDRRLSASQEHLSRSAKEAAMGRYFSEDTTDPSQPRVPVARP